MNTELVRTEASRFDSFSARPAVPGGAAAATEACCEVEIDAIVAVDKPPARKDRRQEVVEELTTSRGADDR